MAEDYGEFAATYEQIASRWVDNEMTGLTARERDFIVANVCVNQSLNGGLMMYYENSYGNAAEDAIMAFHRIGVVNAARVLERSNSLMAEGGPSRNQDERGFQLEALSDEALEEMSACSDQLNAMEQEIRAATLRWVRSEKV